MAKREWNNRVKEVLAGFGMARGHIAVIERYDNLGTIAAEYVEAKKTFIDAKEILLRHNIHSRVSTVLTRHKPDLKDLRIALEALYMQQVTLRRFGFPRNLIDHVEENPELTKAIGDYHESRLALQRTTPILYDNHLKRSIDTIVRKSGPSRVLIAALRHLSA